MMSRLAKPRFLQRRIEHAAQRFAHADGAVEPLRLGRLSSVFAATLVPHTACVAPSGGSGSSVPIMPNAAAKQQRAAARRRRRARLVRSPCPRAALARRPGRPRRGACGPIPIASGSARSCCSRPRSRRSATTTPASSRLWPTVADLAAAPLDAVLVEWAGLGYYARARNLHACAEAVVERHGGSFPTTVAELLTLPGIGPYTAAAIAAICLRRALAVVDGNVDRVLARYLALTCRCARPRTDPRRRAGRGARPRRRFRPGADGPRRHHLRPARRALHALPAAARLRRHAAGDPLAYPVKAEKPERPTRYGHAFVMRDAAGRRLSCSTRADTGLLAKMTETPAPTGPATAPTRVSRSPADWRHRGQVVHVFTHFRLELDVWSATVADPTRLRRRLVGRPARLAARGAAQRVPQGAGGGRARIKDETAGPMHEDRRRVLPDRLEVAFRRKAAPSARGCRRAACRSGARRPLRSMCQKVQPLQASAPWTSAPTRWIEPVVRPERQRAVGPHQRRHSACGRRCSSVPGAIRPISTSEPKARAARRAWRPSVSMRLGAERLDRGDPLQRRRDIGRPRARCR